MGIFAKLLGLESSEPRRYPDVEESERKLLELEQKYGVNREQLLAAAGRAGVHAKYKKGR